MHHAHKSTRRPRTSQFRAITTALVTVIAAVLTWFVTLIQPTSASATSITNGPITVAEVFARAQYWIDHPPAGGYDMGGFAPDPQGVQYRTDCSGFVSMALHLGAPGPNTIDLASSAAFVQLSSAAQLQPGDILDAAYGAGSIDTGHVVLFAGWVPGTSESEYYGYEFGGGAAPTYHEIPYPYFADDPRNFLPYHYKSLVGGATGFEAALQINTHDLWALGTGGDTDWKLGMMAGTSPSIAALSGGGYEVAFQANTGDLWTVGPSGGADWKLGMMAGTSPSIAALSGGGYEVAFQANTGDLWTVGTQPGMNKNWGAGMDTASSPSITAMPNNNYEVAIQTNTHDLWTLATVQDTDWKQGMKAGTSPSVAALTGGGYEVAFHASTDSLITIGTQPGMNKNWSAGMDTASSPSITAMPNNNYEVAIQTNTHDLWTLGTVQDKDWRLGPRTGTSPAIAALPGGGYQVAFQANTGSMWTVGNAGDQNWGAGMDSASSPAITQQ